MEIGLLTRPGPAARPIVAGSRQGPSRGARDSRFEASPRFAEPEPGSAAREAHGQLGRRAVVRAVASSPRVTETGPVINTVALGS